jgi:hypothetical protein
MFRIMERLPGKQATGLIEALEVKRAAALLVCRNRPRAGLLGRHVAKRRAHRASKVAL